MHRFIAVAAAAALLLPAWAEAESPADGFYIAVQTGIGKILTEELDFGGGNELEPEFQSAAFGTLALGFEFNPWRAELEIGYRNNSVENFDFDLAGPPPSPVTASRLITDIPSGGGTTFNADGDVTMATAIVNAIYDFNKDEKLQPFVGIGIGVANVELQDLLLGGSGTTIDDDDTSLAYQLLLGVVWNWNKTFAVEARYTLFGVNGLEMMTGQGESFDYDPLSHSIGLVGRYHFGKADKS